MLPIILFNIPAVNWSTIQGVMLATLSRKGANRLAILPCNLSVTFFIIQGIAFSIFKIAGTLAICAACAAFFAIAGFIVSSSTRPYSDLYKFFKPVFNFGAISSKVDVIILADIPVAVFAKSLDVLLKIFNLSFGTAAL